MMAPKPMVKPDRFPFNSGLFHTFFGGFLRYWDTRPKSSVSNYGSFHIISTIQFYKGVLPPLFGKVPIFLLVDLWQFGVGAPLGVAGMMIVNGYGLDHSRNFAYVKRTSKSFLDGI